MQTAEHYEALFERAAKIVDMYIGHKINVVGNLAAHASRIATALAKARYPWHVVVSSMLAEVVNATGSTYTMGDLRQEFPPEVYSLVSVLMRGAKADRPKQRKKWLANLEAAGKDPVIIILAKQLDIMERYNQRWDMSAFVKYSKEMQSIGERVLGEDHPIVLEHLSAFRSFSIRITSA